MPRFKYPEDSLVIAIDADSFEALIKAHERAFIHFGGSWNPSDHRLIPAIAKAAIQLKDEVVFAVFDVDSNEQFCLKHSVINVPFFEHYVGGKLRESAVGYEPGIEFLRRLLGD